MTLEKADVPLGSKNHKGPTGADVTPGSAVEKAGLLRGDVILTIKLEGVSNQKPRSGTELL